MSGARRVLIAGADTLPGRALASHLTGRRDLALACWPNAAVDLHDAEAVREQLVELQPHELYLVAGRSGGIEENRRRPAELIHDNLVVATNVMAAAHEAEVPRLLFLASSCTYPRDCPQPMRPATLGTGPLEPTSEAYATAKLAGLRMCQAYRRQYGHDWVVAIPSNPFGPEEPARAASSHVVTGLLVRLAEARAAGAAELAVWGSGKPVRDLIFSRDLAAALALVMERWSAEEPINVGSDQPVSIAELALLAREVVGFEGRLVFDTSRPDGAPFKALDATELRGLGWRPVHPLRDALELTWQGLCAAHAARPRALEIS